MEASGAIDLLGIIISTITGFLLAIYSEPLRKRFDRTSISVSFDMQTDILTTPDDKYEFGTYVKIKLQNDGANKYARDIRCFLTSIEKKGLEGEEWHKIFDIPLGLLWSYIDQAHGIDLAPNLWTFFNILSFNKGEEMITPTTIRKPYIWRNDLSEKGFYRFSFFITGENLKKSVAGYVELKWLGEWDTFRITSFHSTIHQSKHIDKNPK